MRLQSPSNIARSNRKVASKTAGMTHQGRREDDVLHLFRKLMHSRVLRENPQF